jgi:hypothetical protein
MITGGRQSGTVYLIVLSCAAIVAILGVASLYAVRMQGRTNRAYNESVRARDCAQSAVALGRLLIAQDPSWRTTRSNGTWISNKALGRGTLTLQVVDPADSSLSDDPYEPVTVTGTGKCGLAIHKTQITLVSDVQPLAALSSCLHASSSVTLSSGKQITVVGGPLSTNADLSNGGLIDGAAEVVTASTPGTVTGGLTTSAATKALPDDAVVTQYIAKASTISYASTIDTAVYGPGVNPSGSVNADGVYYINTSDRDITIRNCRIYGTLIVNAGTHKLVLESAMFMHPYRSDYPVLIVQGNLEIRISSYGVVLDELNLLKNFNPSGAPYAGQWDSDYSDTYPSEIWGLIHVVGNTVLKQTTCIKGALICKGTVTCMDTTRIIHDAGLVANPPQGYTYVAGMKLSPGTYKQVVD